MYYESQGELGRRIAAATESGAATADSMNVGAINAQDVNNAANSPDPNTGLIVQGSTPTNSLGITNPNYVDQLSTEPMYPGHQQAALAAGVGGVNAFGKGHAAWIANNKEQMIALGIIPSHKDPDGNLTGKYSSADWKAFQKALGQQVEVVDNDDTVVMEEAIVAQNGVQPSGYTGMTESIQAGIGAPQAPQALPYGGMTQDIQANIPMPGAPAGIYQPAPGPQATQGYGGQDPFPPGQNFSWPKTPPPGMNIPGTPVQEDLGTGYASEQINMGMGAPLGTGGATPPYGPEMFSTPSYDGFDDFPPGQPYSGQPTNPPPGSGYPVGEWSSAPPPGTPQLSKPISSTLNIEELTNSSISSGGTKQQRRAALSKAGMDKQMLDNMSDVDVAIWNYAILEGGNERLQGATFESLWPRVQELKIKFNSDAGIYR